LIADVDVRGGPMEGRFFGFGRLVCSGAGGEEAIAIEGWLRFGAEEGVRDGKSELRGGCIVYHAARARVIHKSQLRRRIDTAGRRGIGSFSQNFVVYGL
jgi:hypothetical protein